MAEGIAVTGFIFNGVELLGQIEKLENCMKSFRLRKHSNSLTNR